MVSQLPIATMTLSSNGLNEVINTHCYCDQARLAATERSNGRGDGISPLLLWPSLIHIERYMLSTQINTENDIKQNKNVHK
jgi:hypothetical protein